MKKILAVGFAALFAFALVGCAGGEQSAPEEETEAGMANPWAEAASAEEAATNAGIGSFEVADNLGLEQVYPLGEPSFQSMSGIAEADYYADGYKVIVRKGTVAGQELSGDYTEYPESWTQDVDGVTVECKGYETDSATSLSWACDTGYCSVVFYSDGGENIGLTSEQVPALIAGVS